MSGLRQQKNAVLALGAVAFLAVLAGAWFFVVGPERSKIGGLEQDVAAARGELTQRRLELASPSAAVTLKASDLYRLTKALPDGNDMAGIILDVNRLAKRHQLAFTSLAPGAALPGNGYSSQPLNLVLQGRFTDVSGFLGELRQLVRVRKGRLDARGRLYSATDVSLSAPEGKRTFPVVKATVTVQAYTFAAPTASPTSPTTTTPSSTGTVAAGATP
jgi:hypothetical protein